MRLRSRSRGVFLVFAIPLTALLACNALTSIGDYAVDESGSEGGTPDGSIATGDATSGDGMAADTGGGNDAGDGGRLGDGACDPVKLVDHQVRTSDICTTPAGSFGPPMVSAMINFEHCIDTTEVTVAEYDQFLSERGATNTCGQIAVCAWNTSYAPTGPDADAGAQSGNLPQVNVDWCDAFAYCRWAGKHLCGTIAGTGLDQDASTNVESDLTTNVSRDLWDYFCTANDTNPYFYGDTFVAGKCVDAKNSDSGTRPVGSLPACDSTDFATVVDMLGNAAEWEWSCVGEAGAGDPCVVRGGSFKDNDASALGCSSIPTVPRNTTSNSIGFRCCVE